MALYRARARLVIKTTAGLQTIEVGEEFTSTETPGAAWHPLDASAIAASRARFSSAPPTEFSQRYWDTSTGMRDHMRAGSEDPRVTGSFDDPDGSKVVRG